MPLAGRRYDGRSHFLDRRVKIHGHTHLPPPPTQLLPARTSAAQFAATKSSAAAPTVPTWQTAAATALPIAGLPSAAGQPLASRQTAATARGYVLSAPSKLPPRPVPNVENALIENGAGDAPYTRGSIIDIEA
jgi:hypothetical protein